MTDIEIAKNANLENINVIAKDVGLEEDEIENYGKLKAKIDYAKVFERLQDKQNGKLILVTSINPTPLGEGKTTVSIGLADGLKRIGRNSILALREPSLGPVFGIKGGATGGGYAQVAPMEDINLHFTGDIHAITAANNLLSAMIDNHMYFGNELRIKKVIWKRCLDLNDRQLRVVDTGLSGESKIVPRQDGFDITVASEIMAILCLSNDLKDLENRIANIIIGYNEDDKPVYAKDLKAQGAMTALLKDAIKPNLVQTLENTPAIIHGGPFANIAHGCNSIIATKLALKISDYVVTEAGFGSDLGAEKFLDIKCRNAKIWPDVVVLVATIRALKYHGGQAKEDVKNENIDALVKGFKNLDRHIDNLKDRFNLNVVVAINKFDTDTDNEIETLRKHLDEKGITLSIAEEYLKGSEGTEDLANKVIDEMKKQDYLKRNSYIYDEELSIKDKIKEVATKIYGAQDVEYSKEAEEEIARIESLGLDKKPVCIAKTQYSLSDDPKNLEINDNFNIKVEEIRIKNGAGFIVAITGKIMTMPGLPKVPAAENIGVDDNGNIYGIF
jgi:formate--tetrahydrofolate ligase